MKTRQITAAFGLLAIGEFIWIVPDLAGMTIIAQLVTYIFQLIAACVLIRNLRETARAGAILFLLAIVSRFFTFPFEVIGWAGQMERTLNDLSTGRLFDSLSGMDSLGSLLGAGNSFDSEKLNYRYLQSSFSLMDIPFYTKQLLLIGAYICWLVYAPFKRMHKGVISLLVATSLVMLSTFISTITGGILAWPLTYIYDLFYWILGFIVALGYLNMATRTPEDPYEQAKVKALLVFALGLIYTYLIIVSTAYKTLFLVMIGAIIFQVGTANIRDLLKDKRGTGAFVAYGVLMIIAVLFQMIPLAGKLLAFLVQVAALITLGVGLLRLGKGPLFHKGLPTGMNTLGVSSFLLIGGVLTTLIPLAGERISGFIFCALYLPMFLFAFYNMIKATLSATEIILPQPQLVVEPEPVPEPKFKLQPEPVKEVIMPSPKEPSDPDPYKPSYMREESNPPVFSEVRKEVPTVPVPPATEKKPAKKLYFVVGGIALILLLTAGAISSYLLWYKPMVADKQAPRYYTFNNTNLRSSMLSGTDANRITMLPYGTELIVRKQEDGWAHVKYDGIKGYIATPYILIKEDFELLSSIFGDTDSRDCIETARCRRALLQYYKQNNLYGKTEDNGSVDPTLETGWQFFSFGKNRTPNSYYYKRIYNQNSKFPDFAVLLRNIHTKERKILIFTFDDESEAPVLIYESEAPRTGMIKSIVSNPSYYSRSSVGVVYE